MFESAEQALSYIAEHDIAMVDLKVASVPGRWLHVTLPAREFRQKHFAEGVGYDGSSGSGFTTVESGDIAAVPDPTSAFLDPFFEHPTISFLCDSVAADTKQPLAGDPRTVARHAVEAMRSSGVADEAWMGPEFEFHVFDRVRVTTHPYRTRVDIVAAEKGRDGTTQRIPHKSGYLRTPPADQLHDLRTEIVLELEKLGVAVKYHHHEVGAPGQCEIEIGLLPLLAAADRTMLIQYVIKNVAARRGKIATFMPKPIYGEAGNGMHVHQRLTKGERPLFFDETGKNYAGLSDLALQYTSGLLSHGRALAALTNPSTNSFKRLVEGYEAPVNLFFSLANRSAAIRVPRYAIQPHDKRIEYRPPDFTSNVYLALSAMLLAGLDGIASKLDPTEHGFGPHEVNIAQQSAEFREQIKPLPRSLSEALDALSEDRAFLTRNGVFSDAFINNWIAMKRANEAREVAARPHPYEYELYLDT